MFLSGRRRCKSGCSRELCEGGAILIPRIFTSCCAWIWQLTSSQGVRRAGEGDEHLVTAGKCRRCHRHGHSGDPETCAKFNMTFDDVSQAMSIYKKLDNTAAQSSQATDSAKEQLLPFRSVRTLTDVCSWCPHNINAADNSKFSTSLPWSVLSSIYKCNLQLCVEELCLYSFFSK